MQNLTNRLLSFLLAALMGLSGVAYASVVQRISSLETDKKDLASVAEQIRIQTAIMNTNISTMQQDISDLKASQKQTNERVGALLTVTTQNSRDYQAALKHWTEVLDRIARNQK